MKAKYFWRMFGKLESGQFLSSVILHFVWILVKIFDFLHNVPTIISKNSSYLLCFKYSAEIREKKLSLKVILSYQ